MFLFVQGIGVIALLLEILIYQINRRRYILILQAICNLLFAVQYLLLNSINSMCMCLLGTIRNVVFANNDRYEKIKYYILSGFILMAVLITTVNWNGILSLLACIGTILTTLAVWQNKEKYIRLLSLFSMIVWLLHDILIVSYAAVICDSIAICSILIGVYRFDIIRNRTLIKHTSI